MTASRIFEKLRKKQARTWAGGLTLHLVMVIIFIEHFGITSKTDNPYEMRDVKILDVKIALCLMGLINCLYLGWRHSQERQVLTHEELNKAPRPSGSETFHQRLLDVGYTDLEIKNHKYLSFFYDPITFRLMENPAITDTEELVDETTAHDLISKNLRVSSAPLKNFTGSPKLRILLSQLVDDAIRRRIK